MLVSVDVNLEDMNILTRLKELENDDEAMLQIHNTLARYCNPYVPYDTGNLAEIQIEITSDGVIYTAPYARYQYNGIDFNFSRDKHPLASAQWDKAMMQDRGDDFRKEVEAILRKRLRELDE